MQALYSNTTGFQNTASGVNALSSNTTGFGNTASGQAALSSNTSGTFNTALGVSSLNFNTTGSQNTSSGGYALYSNTTGTNNTASGVSALFSNTTGTGLIGLGFQAGYGDGTANMQSTVDNYATFLGYQASRDASVPSATPLTNITAIGKNARVGASNTIVLGGTGADAVNVGIGTVAPAYKLDVSGSSMVTGGLGLGGAVPNAVVLGQSMTLNVSGYSNLNGFRINGADPLNSFFQNNNTNVGFTANAGSAITFNCYNGSFGGTCGGVGGVNPVLMSILMTSGNVGIGATTPLSKLAVNGGVAVGTYAGTTAAPANGLIVSGKIGIGTTNPTNPLTIVDALGTTVVSGAGMTTNRSLAYFGTATVGQIFNITTNDFRVRDQTNTVSNFAVTSLGANILNTLTVSGAGNSSFVGALGIGTTTPAYTLHVATTTVGAIVARFQNGTGYCDINPTNTALVCTSDETLKKNIVTLGKPLDTVMALRGVNFNWNIEGEGTPAHIGFIAQEVEKVVPSLVATDTVSGKKSVNYIGFTPILVEAIKELADKVNTVVGKVAGFAEVFTTKKLCLEDVCVTKFELQALLINAKTNATPTPLITPTSSSTPAVTSAITLQIQGKNPATINVGDVYGDLGAVITAPASAMNYGIQWSSCRMSHY